MLEGSCGSSSLAEDDSLDSVLVFVPNASILFEGNGKFHKISWAHYCIQYWAIALANLSYYKSRPQFFMSQII